MIVSMFCFISISYSTRSDEFRIPHSFILERSHLEDGGFVARQVQPPFFREALFIRATPNQRGSLTTLHYKLIESAKAVAYV